MPGPVAAERVAGFATRAPTRLGVPGRQAAQVAGLMVEADLLGHDTHGLFRPRPHVNRLRDGGCNPAAVPRVVRETAGTALVDGDNGLGHLAMAKARGTGIGWVACVAAATRDRRRCICGRRRRRAWPASAPPWAAPPVPRVWRTASRCTLPGAPILTALPSTWPLRHSRPSSRFRMP